MLFLLVSAALLTTGLLASAALFPSRSSLERAVVAILLANGSAVGIVELLSMLGAIGTAGLLAAAVIVAAFVLLGAGTRAMAQARDDLSRLSAMLVTATTSPTLAAALLVALVVVALAASAAWLLAPWAWESLAYHLPISSDAIQAHVLRPVPTHIVYATAYPHLGAVYLTAFRLALGHDALAELAQVPFAALAVLAIALAARREGVPTRRALALALCFVAVPAVMLELASCEVDVMFASLVLAAAVLATGPLDAPTIGVAALALGLALGTEPTSPLVILAGFAVLAVRGAREKRLGEVFFAGGVVASVGGWTYLENLALYGNPLWPIAIELGPISLDGLTTWSELATRGTSEPFASAGFFERLIDAWLAPFEARPSYDMRRGGLGALFTLGLLPIAIAACTAALRDRDFRERMRRPALFAGPLTLATLAAPHAFWGRYTIAVVGALLAVAAVATIDLRRRWQRAIDVTLIVLAVVSVGHASMGFTVDGPPLSAIAALPEAEREGAYGIDLDEAPWAEARAAIGHGESFAYDPSFNLPGRLFASHQHGRVVYVAEHEPDVATLLDLVAREHTRRIVLGEGPHFTGADAARSRPDRFREIAACPPSLGDPCTLFEVLEAE